MASAPRSVMFNIADRVEIKEQAKVLGLVHLANLEAALQNDQAGRLQEGLADWTANLGVLSNTPKSREILVGVIGETGLGKSSLINALLGFQIAPTSNSEACTAAVCIYGWNHDITDGKNFRAKITFKSYETVEAELGALKFELADLEETSKAQGENPDPEHDDRCAQAIRQIRNVAGWSRLTHETIRTSSPAQIIQSSPAFSMIYKKGKCDKAERICNLIKAEKRQDFVNCLKPYVASSRSELPGTKYWPLVEQVEVFLQSRILRHGIKLVDLPGVMDALESRAQIARSYLHRLEKRIVVTPATRAADNRAAADLILSEQETMFLDMEDMLKPDSLCVAITKIDDIDCGSAEDEFPTGKIRNICRELQSREEANEDESGEGDDFDGSDDLHQTGEKRHRPDEAPARRVRQRTEPGELGEADNISSMGTDDLKSLLRFLCIRERNFELKKKVTDNLLATRSKNRRSRATADTLPTVFPVSSKAFQSFKRSTNESSFEGFPDRESTGIPYLEDWLYQVSLPYREEWVDGDIHHMQVLFDAADGWNQNDCTLLPKLTHDEKEKVEDGVIRLSNSLKKHINTKVRVCLQNHLTAMKPLRDSTLKRTNLVRKTKKGEPQLTKAVTLLRRVVEGWEAKNPRANAATVFRHEKTHWSTYRACVRRNGGPFNRPARNGKAKSTIHWMDDVSHAFWQGHFTNWADEFTRRIPAIKGKIRGTGLKAFTGWIKNMYQDEGLPQTFRDLLKASAFKLRHLFEKYVADVRERVTVFQATSRAKREALQKALTDLIKPGFEAAMKHNGKGIMAKQANAVRTFADAIGYEMFEKVRDNLEKDLAHDIKKLSSDVAGLWTDPKRGCGTLIKAEMTRLSRRLCGKRVKAQTSASIGGETRRQLSDAIGAWRSVWNRVLICLPDAGPLEEFDEFEPAEKMIKVEDADTEDDERPVSPGIKVERFEKNG